jgi:hypothetical protein
MALTKTINLTDNFGEDRSFNDSYIKVTQIKGDKDLMTFSAVFFTDSSMKYSIKLESYDFVPVLNDINFIKQSYEHLKTLPEFAGTTDV